VEFEGQTYKAPSIPKISRRNISSSVIRGAEAVSNVSSPRLRRSKFSFLKKPGLQQDKQALKPESTPIGTLEETNRILVEIQNQLAIDFATRIAERKESVLGIKKRTEKDRARKKERSIESLNKFNQKVSGIFDKVTAPAKSIFQKLMDFFGLIVSGIVINTAFTWLSDKNNQKKLSETLGFIGKYWKEIAGVLIGLQLVSTIAKLVTAIQLVSAVLLSPLFLKTLAIIVAAAGVIALGKALEPVTRERLKQASRAQRGEVPYIRGTGGVGDPYSGLERQLYGSPTAMPGDLDYNRGVQRSKGGTIPYISPYTFKANVIKQYPNIIQRFSTGGTVGGRGSGNVDSVPARLAPGEEVIRASEAMRWRPLLKDINDAGGRMWLSFSSGVKEMLEGNKELKNIISNLNIQLDTFKSKLDEFVRDIKLGKIKPNTPPGAGPTVPSSIKDDKTYVIPIEETKGKKSSLKNVQPVLRQVSVKKSKRTAKAPIIIPMTAPPIVKGGDEMVQPSGGTATEEPQVASTNMLNPYMRITPGIYGIFM
jgi:hypothetical protein